MGEIVERFLEVVMMLVDKRMGIRTGKWKSWWERVAELGSSQDGGGALERQERPTSSRLYLCSVEI